MPEPLNIHEWRYTVGKNTESTIYSASTDRDEIRGLIATTYKCAVSEVKVRRVQR